jgi:hypothetical protein
VRLPQDLALASLGYHPPCLESLVLAPPGLVPLSRVSEQTDRVDTNAPYKNKTAHHVHAGAKAGEEHDLVGRNHPLATGL